MILSYLVSTITVIKKKKKDDFVILICCYDISQPTVVMHIETCNSL